MAYRKSRLRLRHQDLAINADVRTAKLTPEPVADEPEVVRRDERTGSAVTRELYDKRTGSRLEEGYGYRWVNEAGEEVPSEAVRLYVVEDGEERPFSMHEPTVGDERTLSAETWIPAAAVDEYLVETSYEVWGEERADVAQLYELAVHIRDFDQVPVVPFLLQPSIYLRWGIITPFFFDDSFSLIVRVTDRKIRSERRMPILTPEYFAARGAPEGGGAPHLEQESPFE